MRILMDYDQDVKLEARSIPDNGEVGIYQHITGNNWGYMVSYYKPEHIEILEKAIELLKDIKKYQEAKDKVA